MTFRSVRPAPHARTRRSFLATAASLFIAPWFQLIPPQHRGERLAGALKSVPDQYGIGVVDDKKLSSHPIAFRGHSVIAHATKPERLLAFPRRPGNTCMEVKLNSGLVSHAFTCSEQRHLFGHGCFSANGHMLYTTEANLQRRYVNAGRGTASHRNTGRGNTGHGIISVRDATTYQLLDELPSGGVGPHDMKLLSDGVTLAVANGGILTHPRSGREKLNLDTMRSSLTLIDTNRGTADDIWLPAESKASARHIDIAVDGTVAIALQVQRSAMKHSDVSPLAAVLKPGKQALELNEPASVVAAMNDYAGSVAINNKTRVAGFTSPRGNIAAFWNIDSGDFVAHYNLHDVCGIAVSADNGHFIVSNSHGAVRYLDGTSIRENKSMRQHYSAVHWDNHLTAIAV